MGDVCSGLSYGHITKGFVKRNQEFNVVLRYNKNPAGTNEKLSEFFTMIERYEKV